MLENQEFVPNPFYSCHAPKEINSVMINAVGFGGNAVSVILTKA
jgi:3-oxoacyl-(acyl-carrier-protein) synthase